jgi:cytochrome c-type biogenesis protein CcmH/NrfF
MEQKMDQNKTDQILGLLLAKMDDMKANQHEMKAQIGGLASRMDVDKAESEAVRKANKEELMAKMECLLADNREMKADNAELKAEMMARMEAMMDNTKEEMIKAITGAS